MTNKNNQGNYDFIQDDGYYVHSCGKVLIRIDKNASLDGVYCWCYKCHKEVRLRKVVNGRISNGEVKVIYSAG